MINALDCNIKCHLNIVFRILSQTTKCKIHKQLEYFSRANVSDNILSAAQAAELRVPHFRAHQLGPPCPSEQTAGGAD